MSEDAPPLSLPADAPRHRRKGVFICYRRSDTPGYAGRLYTSLADQIGSRHVFRDIDTILPGTDFKEALLSALKACRCVLAVIGPDWNVPGADGMRRLDDPGDFVRLEIVGALEMKVPVVPVLVDGARPPAVGDLPEALRVLSTLQCYELSDSRWGYDVGRLLKQMKIRGPRWTRIGVASALLGIASLLILKVARPHPDDGTAANPVFNPGTYTLADVDAERDPILKAHKANALIADLATRTKHRKVIEAADVMRGWKTLRVPGADHSVQETADFYAMASRFAVRDYAGQLEAAKRFSAAYPHSAFQASVDSLVGVAVDELQRRRGASAKAANELAGMEKKHTEEMSSLSRQGLSEQQKVTLEASYRYNVCITLAASADFERTRRECLAFAETYDSNPDQETRRSVFDARFRVAQALADLQRFDEARRVMSEMQQRNPKLAAEYGLAVQVSALPRD